MISRFGMLAISSALVTNGAAAQDIEAALDALAQDAAEINYRVKELGKPIPIDFDPIKEMPGDYPASSWAAGEQGRSSYSVAVNARGKPTACTIFESSGYAALDAKTCELVMERGVFHPMLDDDDNPIAGEYRGSHNWRRIEPLHAGSSNVILAYTVAADGQVVDCEVVEASGALSTNARERLESQPCPTASFIGRRVFRDENGNPVSRRVTITSAIELSDPN